MQKSEFFCIFFFSLFFHELISVKIKSLLKKKKSPEYKKIKLSHLNYHKKKNSQKPTTYTQDSHFPKIKALLYEIKK